MGFFDSTGGLPGHKAGMFEGSVRSLSMVRWPGKILGGRWSDFPWAFWDVFPTLASLAGVEVESYNLDGVNILPQLLDEGDEVQIRSDQTERYFYFTWVGDGDRFIRTRDPFIKRNGPGYTVRRGR